MCRDISWNIYIYIYKPWLQGRSTVHRRATTSGAWAFATTWGCPRNTPPRNRTSLPVPRRWASRYRGPTCRGLSAFPACPDARRAGRGGREEGCNNDRYSYLRNSLVLSRVLFFFFLLFVRAFLGTRIKRVQSVYVHVYSVNRHTDTYGGIIPNFTSSNSAGFETRSPFFRFFCCFCIVRARGM